MKSILEDTSIKFVNLWGDLAHNWGVSRSMAQVFALLFVSKEPLDTDAIMVKLEISRGNANINIRKLLEWGIIRKIDRKDARRDFFTAERDMWNLTDRIIGERLRREIDPVDISIKVLAQSLDDVSEFSKDNNDLSDITEFRENLLQMAEFVKIFNEIMELILPLIRSKNIHHVQLLLETLKICSPEKLYLGEQK